MEKKPTNPYFSISVGKEKKYMNIVITSDKEATGNADAAAGSNIGSADAVDNNIGNVDAADSNIGSADSAGSNIGSADAAADSNIGSADAAADSNIGSADAAGSNIGNADSAYSNIGNADTAAGSNIGSADSADSNIGSADAVAGSNIGNTGAAGAGSNIRSADAAGSNIGNTGAADGVSAEGSQDQNFSRVVSVNAQAPAKEILLAIPVQNIQDEALASILSYIAQRDAVTDSAIYYGPLVTALVRSRYSEDDVEAIVNNALMVQNMPLSCNEIEERSISAEFEDFQNFRLQCKTRAKEILSLMAEA